MLSLAAVVVAIAVVATVVGINLADDGEPIEAASTAPKATTSAPPSTSSDAQTWVNPSAQVPPTEVRPLQPGWTAVLADPDMAQAAYDVPDTHWQSELNGQPMRASWSDSKDKTIIAMSHASAYRLGFCETSDTVARASVGFYGIQALDPATEGPETAQDFAKAIALKKDDTSHAPIGKVNTRQVTVQGLPAIASTVVATVGDPKEKECSPEKVEVRTLAVSMGRSSTLLVLTRALDVPNGLSGKEATQIMQTLRPAAS